ncbi:MAG: NRDE family protein [Rhodospirillaceae bacterium]
MCTVIVLRRSGHDWPVLIGANRDEMSDRPWRPPGRHWPDRPEVRGGLDLTGGGSWLGLNEAGVVAVVLNRYGTLGPAAGKRSRGELVLEALDHADAAAAAAALADLNPAAYRPFNLVIADNRDAFCLYHRDAGGRAPVVVAPLVDGLSMITAFDCNDPNDPRIRGGLPRFGRAAAPEPERDDWAAWRHLLACREPADPAEARSALCFLTPSGFGTTSSALIALPGANSRRRRRPVWLFAGGPPDKATWQPVGPG